MTSSLHVLLVACLTVTAITAIPVSVDKEKKPSYWRAVARAELDRALRHNDPVVGVAKNVILFLGDGMGLSTVTTGRILAGQLNGENGEDHHLSFDKFPHVALSKTYNVDHQTPDSAGTGTAYLTGVKTNKGTIGVDASAHHGDCQSSLHAHLTSILDWSLADGKSAGVVTTTRVTHATPAATYAHTPHRDWEGSVPSGQSPCKDIASQLVEENPDIHVVMGGGRREFLPNNTVTDPEEGLVVKGRLDGRNLIELWKETQKNKSRNYRYVWNQTEFDAVTPENTDYLLGLFNYNHMEYEADRAQDKGGEPSLREMTEKAIRMLQTNNKGFFLLVEGGRIDHGHHDTNAARALHDTVAFADAVEGAVNMLDTSDTLIVVTADHSHAFAMAGYPRRGNDILGVVREVDGQPHLARDGMPYTTLVYGNGPGFTGLHDPSLPGRQNVTDAIATNISYLQQSIVPMDYETHGGEDVAIYARGPMAHLFHGVHEQNYIPHVMAYASCVGAYSKDAECARALEKTSGSSGLMLDRRLTWLWMLVGALILFA
ncbi:alkaline phosphatase-like isoform X2 [Babylonia areolata]